MRRIYRRICVLRAHGAAAEARELERTELAEALSAARAESPPARPESDLLAQESNRVAEAQLLAELLAPLLADRLRGAAPEFAPRSATAAAPAAPRAAPPPTPRVTAPPPPAAAPSITDLIDGMLSQDRPAHAATR